MSFVSVVDPIPSPAASAASAAPAFPGRTAWRPALSRSARCAVVATALAATLAAPARAEPTLVVYDGQGSFEVLDSSTGQARWSGLLSGFTDLQGQALSLTSTVSFTFDAASHQLSGQFAFSSGDGLTTLFGAVTGSADTADVLTQGGTVELDYTVEGGSGALGALSGFGLAFVQLTPGAAGQLGQDAAVLADSGGRFAESGLFVLDGTVPEPATYGLAALALLGLAGTRRRGAG